MHTYVFLALGVCDGFRWVARARKYGGEGGIHHEWTADPCDLSMTIHYECRWDGMAVRSSHPGATDLLVDAFCANVIGHLASFAVDERSNRRQGVESFVRRVRGLGHVDARDVNFAGVFPSNQRKMRKALTARCA